MASVSVDTPYHGQHREQTTASTATQPTVSNNVGIQHSRLALSDNLQNLKCNVLYRHHHFLCCDYKILLSGYEILNISLLKLQAVKHTMKVIAY